MNDTRLPSFLLPKGFEDLLPPDAEGEANAIHTLMAVFGGAGYARIKPPLLEFEESMIGSGPGAVLADQTFRVMDNQSGKMLALRSDITPQIARIVSSRLGDAGRPLRLSYANDVVRMSGSQQRTLRQFCQVGCELIDTGSDDNLVEVLVLAAKGLQALGIKGVSFDFTLPCVFDDILAAFGASRDAIDPLRVKVSGMAGRALAALGDLDLSDAALADVDRLARILARPELQGLEGVQFTLDPLETKGFEYHKGIAFTVFAKGVNGELGRGGCYALGDALAAGFTFYMDTVRKAVH
ncbi:MAG: ATP phosphoribosyltransferase regulatory subunit [Bdellovibrionales bacterium]